jgi:hypothetical protein
MQISTSVQVFSAINFYPPPFRIYLAFLKSDVLALKEGHYTEKKALTAGPPPPPQQFPDLSSMP